MDRAVKENQFGIPGIPAERRRVEVAAAAIQRQNCRYRAGRRGARPAEGDPAPALKPLFFPVFRPVFFGDPCPLPGLLTGFRSQARGWRAEP